MPGRHEVRGLSPRISTIDEENITIMTKPLPEERHSQPESNNLVRRGRHDYDQEYRKGAHWDKGRPSANIPLFLAYLKGDEKILDAGCGTGRDVFYLSDQGFEVVGADASQTGIDIAKRRASEAGKTELQFDVANIEKLPYEDESFDAIYSGYVLGGETLPGQMAELARVLKSGKILYIAMFLETKYQTPSERDANNPKPFIFAAAEPYFEMVSEVEDTYDEDDDAGRHTHHRLKLVLRKSPHLHH